MVFWRCDKDLELGAKRGHNGEIDVKVEWWSFPISSRCKALLCKDSWVLCPKNCAIARQLSELGATGIAPQRGEGFVC